MLRGLVRLTLIAVGTLVLVTATAMPAVADSHGTIHTNRAHRTHKPKSHGRKPKAKSHTTASAYCGFLSSSQIVQLMGTTATSTQHYGDFVDFPGCTWNGKNPNSVNGATVTLDVNTNGKVDFPGACTVATGGQAVAQLSSQAFFCGVTLTAKKASVAIQLEAPGTSATEADFVADAEQIFQKLGAG